MAPAPISGAGRRRVRVARGVVATSEGPGFKLVGTRAGAVGSAHGLPYPNPRKPQQSASSRPCSLQINSFLKPLPHFLRLFPPTRHLSR
jgi:hypothetical protein